MSDGASALADLAAGVRDVRRLLFLVVVVVVGVARVSSLSAAWAVVLRLDRLAADRGRSAGGVRRASAPSPGAWSSGVSAAGATTGRLVCLWGRLVPLLRRGAALRLFSASSVTAGGPVATVDSAFVPAGSASKMPALKPMSSA
jgi:hypothetical protein